MADALPTSLAASLLGFALGSTGADAGNRWTLEGLSITPGADHTLAIGLARFEATSLRLSGGPITLEAGRLALQQLTAQARMDSGQLHLISLQAAGAEVAGLKVHGPVDLPPAPAAHGSAHEGTWSLGPLADANGTIRAEIVDAHLVFDADVTVPIRAGRIDFREAKVEHVGPDSRMGVSRLGLYVDAPNGRSYLYQFPTTPVAGVEFERRSMLPGPFNTERGSLRLQEFGEGLLRQGPRGHSAGVTQQSRQLFDRTAVSGEVRLGDGKLAAPGLQAELAGRGQGLNTIRLQSQAVGRGFDAELASLSVRNAMLQAGGKQWRCDTVAGALTLRLDLEKGEVYFTLGAPDLKMTGLHAR